MGLLCGHFRDTWDCASDRCLHFFPCLLDPARRSTLCLQVALVVFHLIYAGTLFILDRDLIEKTRREPWYTAIYLSLFVVTLAQYFFTAGSSPGYVLDAMRAVNETDALFRRTSVASKQPASSKNGSVVVTVDKNPLGRNLLGSNATCWSKQVMDTYPPGSSVRTWTCSYCNVVQVDAERVSGAGEDDFVDELILPSEVGSIPIASVGIGLISISQSVSVGGEASSQVVSLPTVMATMPPMTCAPSGCSGSRAGVSGFSSYAALSAPIAAVSMVSTTISTIVTVTPVGDRSLPLVSFGVPVLPSTASLVIAPLPASVAGTSMSGGQGAVISEVEVGGENIPVRSSEAGGDSVNVTAEGHSGMEPRVQQVGLRLRRIPEKMG